MFHDKFDCIIIKKITVIIFSSTIHLFSRRGLTPPHRVKSVSMATFSTEEIDFIKSRGNEVSDIICHKGCLSFVKHKHI